MKREGELSRGRLRAFAIPTSLSLSLFGPIYAISLCNANDREHRLLLLAFSRNLESSQIRRERLLAIPFTYIGVRVYVYVYARARRRVCLLAYGKREYVNMEAGVRCVFGVFTGEVQRV